MNCTLKKAVIIAFSTLAGICLFFKFLTLTGIIGLPDAAKQSYIRSPHTFSFIFVGLIPMIATAILLFWIIYKKR